MIDAAGRTARRWSEVRHTLRRATDDVSALAARMPDPGTRVTADWSLAELLVHLGSVARYDASILARRHSHLRPPGWSGCWPPPASTPCPR